MYASQRFVENFSSHLSLGLPIDSFFDLPQQHFCMVCKGTAVALPFNVWLSLGYITYCSKWTNRKLTRENELGAFWWWLLGKYWGSSTTKCELFLLVLKAKNHYTCTGLFISPSGISELDCATTKTDTAERIISIGREYLQVFFCIRGLGVLPGSTARG